MASSGQAPTKDSIASIAYPDLLERKEAIVQRLDEVAVIEAQPSKPRKIPTSRNSGGSGTGVSSRKRGSPTKRGSAADKTEGKNSAHDASHEQLVPYEPKTDTHWDFVMKEMMWLGADFQAERKRQISLAKKLAGAIRLHHKTKESRRLRELAEAELKRRRLAGRISRELRGWWTKIERVVAYKQKLSADEERKKAMNKQLVALVKQTERYSESLMLQQQNGRDDDNDDDYDDDEDDMSDSDNGGGRDDSHGDSPRKNNRGKRRRRRRQPRQHHHQQPTIEEVLASEQMAIRKSKTRVTDYSRLRLAKGDDALYGESTASDSGSDASYSPESEEEDDETTLREAELDEIEERKRAREHGVDGEGSSNGDTTESFVADPDEIRKLHEEVNMGIEDVIERFRSEAASMEASDVVGKGNGDNPDSTTGDLKKVKFAPTALVKEESTTITETLKKSEDNKNGNSKPDDGSNSDISSTAQLPNRQHKPATTTEDGHDADDDGDASDVEDYVIKMQTDGGDDSNSDGEGSEEFEADEAEVDDETTMAAEELLPREMSAEEEINILKQESEMSIEELRARYAKMEDSGQPSSDDDDNDDNDDKNNKLTSLVQSAKPHEQNTNLGETTVSEPSTTQMNAKDAMDSEAIQPVKSNGASRNMLDGAPQLKLTAASINSDHPSKSAAGSSVGTRSGNKLKAETSGQVDEMADSITETEPTVTFDSTAEKNTLSSSASNGNSSKKDLGDKQDESDQAAQCDEQATVISPPHDVLSVPENMNDGGITDGKTAEKGSSPENSASNDTQEDDEEFQPPLVAELDDETTIEAEERLGRDMSHEEEMALLKSESEMPIEQLRAMYAAMENEAGVESESDAQSSAGQDIDEGSDDEKNESLATMLTASSDPELDSDEYQPDDEAVDDETTMEAEEKLGRDMSHDEELALLKRESEMSVEELRAMYANMETESDSEETSTVREDLRLLNEASDDTDAAVDDEFEPEDDAVDDETTMEAEEKLGREIGVDEEIAALKRDGEVPIESLLEMYNKMEEARESPSKSEDEKPAKRKMDAVEADSTSKKPRPNPEEETSDDGLAALSVLEASAERARKTLASRPYFMASWVKLREYQQVGLNWLVSLQSRRLNGILADEMGLGKTLQTISLLAYLAAYKGIWGPHLVVVPTSVIINWETELKRFCPALKVLCYYGSAKRRKELRTGWTKTNWYHVVITSYQLAVQDAFAFKRKRWYYLILDEAQNIKNFQSQRWQTLINFNTQRRLLLTGTPLQNNLMELWSLLHFLMPYIFRSRKEFSYWFSNPMNSMIEGNSDRNDEVIQRLHGIIRPFVLRRLKKDVEKQMPGKFEHVVKCQLSRRQMTIYEEFLARSSTRVALQKGGNFMGMMNVLMQLRKVCNHPDLFEPRSVVTPFVIPGLSYTVPGCVCQARSEGPVVGRLSAQLLVPLWCGSSGLPSLGNSLKHSHAESIQLRRLKATHDPESLMLDELGDDVPIELKPLVEEIRAGRLQARKMNKRFQNKVNTWRCRSPAFTYPSSLLHTLEAIDDPFDRDGPVQLVGKDIVLTPSHLFKMRRTQQQRADDMDELIDKFVFCVPKAGSHRPTLISRNVGMDRPTIPTKQLDDMLLEPLNDALRPFRKVEARLSSFFPDKRLIQFDAGKLQTLAELLRTLKKGGHRALIFTQMSKMLDTLEAFLNINGHTYLRLDGSTGVDRRQRYMDRFNNDTKIFCFILSTRSGGMGINLTGADTVIFYDSDWNPAMDAQAQDRAHRIGQTRDVHIYRLITEHTIEENILIKANQKKNLDIMVMNQGNFDASQPKRSDGAKSNDDQVQDVYTKGGLRAILGVTDLDNEKGAKDGCGGDETETKEPSDVSKENLEMAMASLEDDDDVKALRGAQKEAAEEMKEFDENAEIKKDSDDEDEDTGEKDDAVSRPTKKQKSTKEADPAVVAKNADTDSGKNEEAELEKEFAAWQSTVGLDADAIASSLSPMERYGLIFREEIDPFYSIFSINEQRRRMEATDIEDTIDVDEIEREKALEERRAMDEGDLLATKPRPEDLIRQRNFYRREKVRRRAEKKRRTLTGENWESKIDGTTQNPFWYNSDTGEAIWDKPSVLIELEAEELARGEGWSSMPLKPLSRVMEFLVPFPERMQCSAVCRQWRGAANDIKFVRHVYPVEMGAIASVKNRREYNHYSDIAEALAISLPGDTLELADGHYWVNNPGLLVNIPIQIVGDENNAANVVIEMSGSIRWHAKGGWIEGVTFRRPKIATGVPPADPMLRIERSGRVDIVHSVLDNEGSTGTVVSVSGEGQKGRWHDVSIRGGAAGGMTVDGEGSIELSKCIISKNGGHGLQCQEKGKCSMMDCRVESNIGFGIRLVGASSAVITKCKFEDNTGGTISKATGCTSTCSTNIAIIPKMLPKTIPGFRLMTKSQHREQKELENQGKGAIPADDRSG